MKLDLEQIKSIAVGVEYAEEKDGKIFLHRFNKDEEELYRVTNADFYKKTAASAGVRLEFVTNSSTLSIKTEVSSGSSRKYFAHSIFVDGKKYASLGAKTDTGIFSGCWTLPEGEKTVCVYFPWSTSSFLHSVELDDGATVTPVKKDCVMLIYGDSITHGYDASSPELSYASMLADALCADARNKGIGAEVFRPELAEASNTENVKYISVAYGTNDWGYYTYDEFKSKCHGFYKTLSEKYPDATIFALTPVWRKHWLDNSKSGKFYVISEFIHSLEAEIPNLKAIECLGFIPADLSCFSPDGVHPNDKGFSFYGEKLVETVKKYI